MRSYELPTLPRCRRAHQLDVFIAAGRQRPSVGFTTINGELWLGGTRAAFRRRRPVPPCQGPTHQLCLGQRSAHGAFQQRPCFLSFRPFHALPKPKHPRRASSCVSLLYAGLFDGSCPEVLQQPCQGCLFAQGSSHSVCRTLAPGNQSVVRGRGMPCVSRRAI